MILYPEATFNGASNGLETWVMVLIPALLPFFIIADIMVELGILNFFGVILEPLMRPVFKQPGAAGFVLAMGFTSGFPMGAILTNRLYENNLCTKEEASRLIAFTNNSSPLFLLVAIPVGMFENPTLGILLAISHYAANIILGIVLGLKKRDFTGFSSQGKNSNLLIRGFQAFINCRHDNPISVGALMGKAVNKSINNILLIGGFVIFFAVLIEILEVTQLGLVLSLFFSKIFSFVGFNPSLANGITAGIFEMTLGAKTTSEIAAPLREQAMLVSFILGWSGLSIQAQIISIVSHNKIPVWNYLGGRLFHGVLAAFLTGLLYKPVFNLPLSISVLNLDKIEHGSFDIWYYYYFNLFAGLSLLSLLIVLSLVMYLYIAIKKKLFSRGL